MARSHKNGLPTARIAHRYSGPLSILVAFFRPLKRLRMGKSELVAVSIVSGIVLVVGLMLAGFGAANRHGLSEKYLSSDTQLSQEEPDRSGHISELEGCRNVYAEESPCEDIWARAMAGIDTDEWSGDEDWYQSQCRRVTVCVAQ